MMEGVDLKYYADNQSQKRAAVIHIIYGVDKFTDRPPLSQLMIIIYQRYPNYLS